MQYALRSSCASSGLLPARAALPALGELAFENFPALDASPALVTVFARSGSAQKIHHQLIGVHGERVVEYPHRWQHRQLAVSAVKLVASYQGAYALSLEHAADQMRFGRMFRGVYQLHILALRTHFASNPRPVNVRMRSVRDNIRHSLAVHESIAAARFVFRCGLDTMFETKRQEPIPRQEFIKRVASAIGISAVLAAISLALGVIGYHHFGELTWIDALHNAAMILGGMGLVSEMKSDAAKVFSSAYALFSGLVFVAVIAVTLAPIMHRVLHKFHIDEADVKK